MKFAQAEKNQLTSALDDDFMSNRVPFDREELQTEESILVRIVWGGRDREMANALDDWRQIPLPERKED